MNATDLKAQAGALDGNALVADVGGSNARFGWLDGRTQQISHVLTLPVNGHSGLVEAARAYLGDMRQHLGPDYKAPRAAALAVATAVTGDLVEWTNSLWSFSQRRLRDELQLDQLRVVNDFEALALALPHLGPAQVRAVQSSGAPTSALAGGSPAARAWPMAVVGPGTGLGVASIVPTAQGWVAVAGEGGHASLAPGNDFEAQILSRVRRRFPHVSAERLLSGIGLPVLYAAVADIQGLAQTGDDHPQAALDAPAIVDAGLAGDPLARQTLDVFCALLGSFAGNVALTVGSRGGLYIGGGIVPRLGAVFDRSAFRTRFEAKGRLSAYLATVPTWVITDTLAALTGAAAALVAASKVPVEAGRPTAATL